MKVIRKVERGVGGPLCPHGTVLEDGRVAVCFRLAHHPGYHYDGYERHAWS